MKGIIFNLAEDVVARDFGDEAWDAILDDADVSGSYTSLGSYPDSDLLAIIAAAANRLALEPNDVLRHVAEGAMPLLAERYPHFFEPHTDTCSFVLTLNDIIHPEVRKLYPGASVPTFSYSDVSPSSLTLGYSSERRLCALAEGFVRGAAKHFGQHVVMEQTTCMLRGDDTCLLRCELVDGPA